MIVRLRLREDKKDENKKSINPLPRVSFMADREFLSTVSSGVVPTALYPI